MESPLIAEFEAFLAFLRYQRTVVDYVYVSAVALMAYDYILTVESEIKLIWTSPWNLTKILFLLVRYIQVALPTFTMITQLALNVPPNTCNWAFPAMTWLMMVGIFLAEVVLVIRTWTLWRKNAKVGFVLASMMSTSVGLASYGNVQFIRSLSFAPGPYPGYRGCLILTVSRVLKIDFIALVVFECIVLALMVLSVRRTYKLHEKSQLSDTIHRDGIMLYLYVLVATFANMIIITFANINVAYGFVPIVSVLYSNLTCRVVLRIRKFRTEDFWRVDSPDPVAELHGYRGQDDLSIPLGQVSQQSCRPANLTTVSSSTEMISNITEVRRVSQYGIPY